MFNSNRNSDTEEENCQQCMSHLTSILMTMTSKPKILFEAMGVSTTATATSTATTADTATSTNIATNGGIVWTMDEDGKGIRLQIPQTQTKSFQMKENEQIKSASSSSSSSIQVSAFGGGAISGSNDSHITSSSIAIEMEQQQEAKTQHSQTTASIHSNKNTGTGTSIGSSSIISEEHNHNNPNDDEIISKGGILQRMKTKLNKTFSKQLATSSINNNNNNNDKIEPNHITLEIQCRQCGNSGPEGSARAYLRGPSPLSIILCTNRLSLTDPTEINEVLTHELIHVYDVHNRKWDFTNCQTLAKSEIRAAREAECNIMSNSNSANSKRNYNFGFWAKEEKAHSCVRDKACEATKNMFPYHGFDCVNQVFDEAMLDTVPFGTAVLQNGKEEGGGRSTIATSSFGMNDNKNNNNNDHEHDVSGSVGGFIGGRYFTSSFSS